MKVAFLGGLSVPEGQVPFPLSALAKHRRWNLAPSAYIGLNLSTYEMDSVPLFQVFQG